MSQERNVRFHFRIHPALEESEELPSISAAELDALLEHAGASAVVDAMAKSRGFEGAKRHQITQVEEDTES
jgi:hypothetical protein